MPGLEVFKSRLYVFLFGLAFFVLLSAVIVFGFYRYQFSGGISSDGSDWSTFGTYVGGVLGPIISFAALLGLLVTAKLQRDVFVLQQQQYNDLAKQQLESANAQSRQLQIATDTLEHGRVNSYKSMVIQMLQHRVDIHNQSASAADEKIQVIWREFGKTPEHIDMERITELASSRDENKRQAAKIARMILTLALREHPTVSAFRDDVAAALEPDEG